MGSFKLSETKIGRLVRISDRLEREERSRIPENELWYAIASLSEAEQRELAALVWMGRDYQDLSFDEAYALAASLRDTHWPDFLSDKHLHKILPKAIEKVSSGN